MGSNLCTSKCIVVCMTTLLWMTLLCHWVLSPNALVAGYRTSRTLINSHPSAPVFQVRMDRYQKCVNRSPTQTVPIPGLRILVQPNQTGMFPVKKIIIFHQMHKPKSGIKVCNFRQEKEGQRCPPFAFLIQ